MCGEGSTTKHPTPDINYFFYSLYLCRNYRAHEISERRKYIFVLKIYVGVHIQYFNI